MVGKHETYINLYLQICLYIMISKSPVETETRSTGDLKVYSYLISIRNGIEPIAHISIRMLGP